MIAAYDNQVADMNKQFRQVYITEEQAQKIMELVMPLMPRVNRLAQPTIHSGVRCCVDFALAELVKRQEQNEPN